MSSHRLLSWSVVTLLACARLAGAQARPGCSDELAGESLRFIVPQAPGGGYDVYARLMAPVLGRELGVRVVVDNVVGAAGLVGANELRRARPDGATLGILNTAGLLMTALREESTAPDPREDFHLVGRVATTPQIWASGRDSDLRTLDDVLRASLSRPILFGIQDVGSTAFAGIVAAAHLTDLRWEFVAGYTGTLAMGLAVLRDEVDLVAASFESIRPAVDSNELRPLLQVTDHPISDHPALANVPVLGGPDGFAVRKARALGRDPDEAGRLAEAVVELFALGRVVAAPAGVDGPLASCLAAALAATLSQQSFLDAAARAGRSIEPRSGPETLEAVLRTARGVEVLLPRVRDAIARSQP